MATLYHPAQPVWVVGARYGHVQAIALFDTGQREEAVAVLQDVHERHPADAGVLQTLAEYSAALGRADDALRHRAALRELHP